MLGAGQHERRVDLVAHHPGTVADDDVADALELGPGEDAAPRVVRLGEEQRLGTLGEEPVQAVEVDLGTLGGGGQRELSSPPRHPASPNWAL